MLSVEVIGGKAPKPVATPHVSASYRTPFSDAEEDKLKMKKSQRTDNITDFSAPTIDS